MMSEIRVVDLTVPEFAYLLATLRAQQIIGVDDPKLFPAKETAREKLFAQGREELEAHGWLKPIEGQADEYDLDPELFHLVSIIASPDVVIATQHNSGDKEQHEVLHYLADENIVELAASDSGYLLGIVPDASTLVKRTAAMLQLAEKAPAKRISIDGELLEAIRSFPPKGRLEKARTQLQSAGIEGKIAEAFLEAIDAPAQGQTVVIRIDSGEVQSGRRVLFFGEGKQAWSGSKSDPDETDVEVVTCDVARWNDTLTALLDEFTD